ncbi:hypothetical protein SNA_25235 [Streptomyces natalensis ATCC 27448]|uniref:Uncharacterized protein n=2 Tax=Streptomyces natalensis TaxID=68242 RepID=A0A0D7CHA1_9ACTN|nr:hypothetical protein SNA_25235 [Streptomyces natalensis ATCC 27448]
MLGIRELRRAHLPEHSLILIARLDGPRLVIGHDEVQLLLIHEPGRRGQRGSSPFVSASRLRSHAGPMSSASSIRHRPTRTTSAATTLR